MLAVQIYTREEESGKQLAQRLADVVKSRVDVAQPGAKKMVVLGPAAASIGKINDIFRFVFYIKHSNYDTLVEMKDVLEQTLQQWQPKNESVQFDFDPMNTL